MTDKEMIRLAEQTGFTKASVIDTADMKVVQEYRKYCEENLCGNFNANWGCPPDCGSPQFMEDRIRSYRRALILQTVTPLTVTNDPEEVKAARKKHIPMARTVIRALRDDGMDTRERVMLPGCCSFCAECTKPTGEPCRFPEEQTSCLSAYNMDVAELCRICGMELNWDGSTISYISVVLMDPIEDL